MNKIKYVTLILLGVFLSFYIGFFNNEVKANQIQPDPSTAVYIEMEFTEYEVFNNGIDVIYELEVIRPLTNYGSTATSDLLLYMTQQLETAIWVLPLPHNYYIEIQTPEGTERISTFVRTLVFNNHNDTFEGYRQDGIIDFTITYSDIVQMGGTKMYAWRNSTTGMTETQEIYNEGFSVGYSAGYDRGYGKGYGEGYDFGYGKGYDEGFNDLENLTDTEQYEKGKKDAQMTALGSFDKWFVPAVIVIIILGGFVTIIQKRKDGDT